jgi:hypothetical protein
MHFPQSHSDLTVTAIDGGLLLQWPDHPDPAVVQTQVWEAGIDDPFSASLIALVVGTSYLRTGLEPGSARCFWIVAVGTMPSMSYPNGPGIIGRMPERDPVGARTREVDYFSITRGIAGGY